MSVWKMLLVTVLLLLYSSSGMKVKKIENRDRRDEKSPGEVLSERLASTFQKKMAALDPVHLEFIPIAWENGGCYARGNLNDTNVTGLSLARIRIEKFDTETFALSVLVEVPHLKGNGKVAVDSAICGFGQLTSNEATSFLLALTNITARVVANFTAVGHQVQVGYLDMSVNFTGAEFEAPHLFTHPAVNELVAELITSHGPQIFNILKPLMKDCVQKKFREKMNEFLATADLFGSVANSPSPGAK